MEIQILKDIFGIFALSTVVILIFHRVKVPAVVGFLFTGVIAGPHGLKLIGAVHEVEILAEIGVVLLLFTLGIEFSLKKLLRIKKAVFLGGAVQVVVTILTTALIVIIIGFPVNKAVFFGFLVALSSTAIVMKVIQDRAEVNSPHGQTSLAILIFQDIVIVPMILLTPILAGATQAVGMALVILTLKIVGIIIVTVVLAKWVVHGVLFQVARTRSRELFLLSILLTCLGVAWLTSSLGLSLAMGAFLAGLIISESEYSHSAFGHIIPFRDLFISFFFVSIGMLLDVGYLFSNLGMVFSVVLGLLILKAAIAGFVGTLMGLSLRAAILVGFALAQVGEFSFILSKFGLEEGLILPQTYQLFLAASVLSMAFTPFFIAISPKLAGMILKLPLPEWIGAGIYPLADSKKVTLENHLVIVGFGVNGKNLARAAKLVEIPYTVIEMNPVTVRHERGRGEPIFYGDATQESVLEHAYIKSARAMVVAIPDAAATESITELSRRLNSSLHIVVRTRFLQEVDRLYQLGADYVIPEEFETSVELFTKVLNHYSVPEEKIQDVLVEIRAECYKIFRRSSPPPDLQARLDLNS